jgi:CBS domain-containing protein
MHTVDQYMTKNVRTARLTDVVGPLRDVMLQQKIHAVPVLDDDNDLVGIVTSSDLVEEWAPQMGVQTVMSTDVRSVAPGTLVTDAARSMVEGRIHHLVVVDRGVVVGMVSSFDLLSHLAGRVEQLVAEQAEGGLRAEVGDTIVVRPTLHGTHERRAKVMEVHGPDGTSPFTVRWSDDPHDTPHLTMFFPGNDAYVEKAGETSRHP